MRYRVKFGFEYEDVKFSGNVIVTEKYGRYTLSPKYAAIADITDWGSDWVIAITPEVSCLPNGEEISCIEIVFEPDSIRFKKFLMWSRAGYIIAASGEFDKEKISVTPLTI